MSYFEDLDWIQEDGNSNFYVALTEGGKILLANKEPFFLLEGDTIEEVHEKADHALSFINYIYLHPKGE